MRSSELHYFGWIEMNWKRCEKRNETQRQNFKNRSDRVEISVSTIIWLKNDERQKLHIKTSVHLVRQSKNVAFCIGVLSTKIFFSELKANTSSTLSSVVYRKPVKHCEQKQHATGHMLIKNRFFKTSLLGTIPSALKYVHLFHRQYCHLYSYFRSNCL